MTRSPFVSLAGATITSSADEAGRPVNTSTGECPASDCTAVWFRFACRAGSKYGHS
ncbi:hypothetical protein PF010_g32388 [Phytophthora fragariae]|uniref:Uncharacterized protein n=1 Tax=Phytophthora fragariae TaxID=53985 RepID=A0A6G0JET8_9STRA|nr:hypothetical protein PF010_g32388 [Phytophthora fragariae]KAE9157695.1 hypothetical protein PF004_g32127 [Phytophthora fragariae]KAE9157697.1 hypothetical protein PF004_g32126 [Phytophthora fragariae]